MKKLFTIKSKKPETVYIRFSGEPDIDAILGFYKSHPHQDIRGRDLELFKQQACDGNIILLEKKNGEILGASIVYPLATSECDCSGNARWHEIGTLRLALNGYKGLFDIMIAAQSLRTFLVDPPLDSLILQTNPAVYQKIETIGWHKFIPAQALIEASLKTLKSEDVTEKDKSDEGWFKCALDALPLLARAILNVKDNPVIHHAKTDAKIKISFERMGLVHKFDRELRELADKKADGADRTASLQAARKQWLKRLK